MVKISYHRYRYIYTLYSVQCTYSYRGQHAAALPVGSAAAQEGDDDPGDRHNEEQDHRTPIRWDVHIRLNRIINFFLHFTLKKN